jgi:uracil-DNA glycosylase
MTDRITAFQVLAQQAATCQRCPRLCERSAVLSHQNGNLSPKVIFIGEAPGRLGADRTRIPLVGDMSGRNFDLFLTATGLTRQEIFITNAVLCNPRQENRNLRPLASEIRNCASFLQQQIDLLQPPIVATLGSVALQALTALAPHSLTLNDVGQAYHWYRRQLIPLYHPSPHVVNGRRRVEQQLQDYGVIAATLQQLKTITNTKEL